MSHVQALENAAPLCARKSGPLAGVGAVPGDKSISQRALILGALAEGTTHICGLLESGDVHSTAAALGALGARLDVEGPGRWRVTGTGVGGWKSPSAPLDFGNSGTGSRLVMGAMATTPITVVFTGDASLRARPMARVVRPLEIFGTTHEGQGPDARMPLTLHGVGGAEGVQTHVATPSAQVKSALLLAALNARGTTRIRQSVLTRDHTERMLAAFGADIAVTPLADGGEEIALRGPAHLRACTIAVPRDPSSAAFPLVAALIVPGSRIELPGILLNPRRIGLIETLLEMGADIHITNRRISGGEDVGDLIVRHGPLKGVTVPAARSAAMIDEYPILAVAAANAQGETHMLGLGELRVKESDRLAAVAAGLAANGVPHTITGDDLTVTGLGFQGVGFQGVPGGGVVATHMDHRIAMSFLTMGLASRNPVTVDDTTMIATSFPDYMGLMKGLGAVLEAPA